MEAKSVPPPPPDPNMLKAPPAPSPPPGALALPELPVVLLDGGAPDVVEDVVLVVEAFPLDDVLELAGGFWPLITM